MNPGSKSYLEHIDGIRALAVIAVLLFHFGVNGFAAGFIGVDIFFVISGFVISRLLLREMEVDRTIHFANFYRRRARRLLPALAFTFLITSIGVYLFFSPENLVAFGGSLTSAAFSVSNLLFWYESGYFDVASHTKPLLHTWSLSVEEQFYVFWPLVLWALVRARLLLIGIVTLFAGSFLLNYLWVASNEPDSASAMFFLTPFRVFEFAVGALCVLVEKKYKLTRIHQNIGFLLGVVLITYSMVTLDKSSVFPYINALPVCFGTALLILTGESFGARKLLGNAPALMIGKLSYSLYLMHWPVYVFARYLNINTISLKNTSLMVLLTLVLAMVSYWCIEQPFRKADANYIKRWGVAFCVSLMLLFGLLGLGMKLSDGWTWRYDNKPLSASDIERGKSGRYKNTLNACSILEFENATKCPMDRPIQILVLGNSHEPDGFNMFHYLYGNNENVNLITFGTTNGCSLEIKEGVMYSPENELQCGKRFAMLGDPKFFNKITHIVYSTHTGFEYVAINMWSILENMMQKNKNIKLIALGSYLETSMDCATIKNNAGSFDACKSPDYVTFFKPNERAESPVELSKTLPYLYINKFKMLCPTSELSSCLTFANGEPMFYDVHHLSFGFATYVGELIANNYAKDLKALGLPPPNAH